MTGGEADAVFHAPGGSELAAAAAGLADDAVLVALFPADVLSGVPDGADPRPHYRAAVTARLAAAGLVLHDLRLSTAGAAPLLLARAGRRPLRSRLLLQAFHPMGHCNEIRIGDPGRALASRPEVRYLTAAGSVDLAARQPGEDVLFLWQRPVVRPPDLAFVRRLLAAGYLLVTEFDDHPDAFPGLAEADWLAFRAAHAVQVSTTALADLVRPWNPNVAVLPNAVPALPPRRKKPADRTVMFFGALNRGGAWAPLLPALLDVLHRHAGRVHVEVVHDAAFFEALGSVSKRFTPTCPYPAYLDILSGCHLAWLPLDDTPFNRTKSDLKFLEAAACGAAVLASPTVYADTIVHGETGLIFHGPDDFARQLDALLRDGGLRDRLAATAGAHVRDNRLFAQALPHRLAWYRSLVAERDGLTRDLLARVPELRP